MSTELCPLRHGYGWVTVAEAPHWRDHGPLRSRGPDPLCRCEDVYGCGRCEGIGNVGTPRREPAPLRMERHLVLKRLRWARSKKRHGARRGAS